MKWEIHVDGAAVPVAGFHKAKNARGHAEKHFLCVSERWEQLNPEPPPSSFRDRLAEGEPTDTVLDDAARVYVGLTKAESAHHRTFARWGYYVPPGQRSGYDALQVATPRGIFCVFASGRVSAMATAFRPLPARRRGPVSLSQFHQEAHRRALRKF